MEVKDVIVGTCVLGSLVGGALILYNTRKQIKNGWNQLLEEIHALTDVTKNTQKKVETLNQGVATETDPKTLMDLTLRSLAARGNRNEAKEFMDMWNEKFEDEILD